MIKLYEVIDERQHDCMTVMLIAKCNHSQCEQIFTGVSTKPEKANQLILRKAKTHWARIHGKDA